MTKLNLIFTTLITFFVFMLNSCNDSEKVASEGKVAEVLPDDIVELRYDQQKLANITTGTIEMHTLKNTLKVNGTVVVAPQDMATVCMPMGGFIRSTSILPGIHVTKGQVLAIIESQDFIDLQENYLEAKNRLEFAEAEFNRHNELYKDDVYSQKNLQEVTADFKSLKAQVRAYEQKLILIGIDYLNVNEENISLTVPLVSPITGYVKTADINLGKYVAPSDMIFEIVNSDKLLLELALFEKDANKAVAGQKILFYVNNEEEQHEAVIYQAGNVIGADKTFKVYARVAGSCENVLPGMYVNAYLETSGEMVYALPSDGIVSFDDKDYIFMFNREKEESGQPFTEYRMIQVRKGNTYDGYTEVILPEGFDTKNSKVVIKGAYNLLSAKKNAGEMAC
jgi:cobalt-zinc-cadmium efflux system membrane fusion protein